MIDGRFQDLAPSERRRLILRAVLGSTATSAGIVLVYYVLPLDGDLDPATFAGLCLGLAASAVLLVLQTRAILRADYPGLRAVQALACTVPLVVVLFAATYYLTSRSDGAAFSEDLTRTDAIYFTVTVLSTVGFGDIAPVSTIARVTATTQMLVDLLLVGIVAKVLFGAVQIGVDRKRREGAATTDQPSSAPGAGPQG